MIDSIIGTAFLTSDGTVDLETPNCFFGTSTRVLLFVLIGWEVPSVDLAEFGKC